MKLFRGSKRGHNTSNAKVSIFRKLQGGKHHAKLIGIEQGALLPPDMTSASQSDESIGSLFEGITSQSNQPCTLSREASITSFFAGISGRIQADIELVTSHLANTFVQTIPAGILIAILLRQPIFILYAILLHLLQKIVKVASLWLRYTRDDAELHQALAAVFKAARYLVTESEKAASGDYRRLVEAGYVLYNCTGTGESYLSYILRYRMSMVNYQVIDEIREWREKRLGYEAAKSRRNLFA